MKTPDNYTLDCEVGADEIAHGIARDCERCPLALAITRAATNKFGRTPELVSVEYLGASVKLSVMGPLFITSWKEDGPENRFVATFDGLVPEKSGLQGVFRLHFSRLRPGFIR